MNDTVLDYDVIFEENDFYDFVEQIKATFKDSLIIDLPKKKTNKVNVDIYADIVEDNVVIELIDINTMLEGLSIIDKQLENDDIKLPIYKAFKLEGTYFNQADIEY